MGKLIKGVVSEQLLGGVGMASVSVHALSTYANILMLMKRIEGTRNYFSYEELVDAAKKEGLSPEFVNRYIEKLRAIGTIYSPKPGVFKFAD